ncbi:hypothetical protein CCAX7_59760 [Capsulimonas corticalis]|uniref:Uncharacterized protein n=1 Tax=Capsulimonas corticalis TaxID=2219043 RepID=A0A402CZM3_9BACT|nr:hypothetical protein CCAX7_59760 [Capsulimonas corticalis]
MGNKTRKARADDCLEVTPEIASEAMHNASTHTPEVLFAIRPNASSATSVVTALAARAWASWLARKR